MFASRRVAVCTIAARNYIALAGTMLASVARFEPALDRFVFIVDDVDEVETFAEGRVLRPADVFERDTFAELARGYDVLELSTAVKPSVLRHLLDRGYERVLFFDPDIVVYAALDPLLEPLETNNIALTPHWVDALPIERRLRLELLVMRTGVFNLGFIGVANTPVARAMLDWWAERLARYCRIDAVSGLFVDQRWIDLVPGLFAGTAIVRHRGCNVAYWNLSERRLDAGDEPRLESGEPLVFFHFSGFDPRHPDRLCKISTWIRVSETPRSERLLAAYAQALAARGHNERRSLPYGLRRSLRARARRFARHVLPLAQALSRS